MNLALESLVAGLASEDFLVEPSILGFLKDIHLALFPLLLA
jgi:hypothetical protein